MNQIENTQWMRNSSPAPVHTYTHYCFWDRKEKAYKHSIVVFLRDPLYLISIPDLFLITLLAVLLLFYPWKGLFQSLCDFSHSALDSGSGPNCFLSMITSTYRWEACRWKSNHNRERKLSSWCAYLSWCVAVDVCGQYFKVVHESVS